MRHVSSIIAPSQWLFYARARIWRKKIPIGVAPAHTHTTLLHSLEVRSPLFRSRFPRPSWQWMREGRRDRRREGRRGGSFRSGPTSRTRRTTSTASSCATFCRGHRLLLSQIRGHSDWRRRRPSEGATLSGGSINGMGHKSQSFLDQSIIRLILRLVRDWYLV